MPHGRNLEELALMVECGMSPAEALLATTRIAAELIGSEDAVGTIEPGKLADLVVVDGDPFDVKTLPGRIRSVYQDGVLVTA
jgi:imidazolonepropionase-like amidohydrolase